MLPTSSPCCAPRWRGPAPAPPDEVIAFACDLLGVAPPPPVPFEQAELSPMARSFYADNKRVRNDRIKRDLGVTLRYPDYRTGLRALLSDSDATAANSNSKSASRDKR